MNQDSSGIEIKDSVRLPSQFRIKSDLMLQMEKIQPEIFQVKTSAENIEEAAEPKLTREEMIQRSRELRAIRLKESQKSVKAHHQNKIKSKKFHRILKKEKMKQQIKEFELLQKTDPEAALRKIEQLDRSRIEERANLRHRNTGTWAKNLQVRAKYDKEARKDLAEQIAISREITAKKTIDESDDDDDMADDNENNETSASDPFNPWIISAGGGSNTPGSNEVEEFVSDYRKYWQERNQNEKKLKEYQSEEESEKDEPDLQNVDENLPKQTQSQTNGMASKLKKNEKPKPARVAVKKTKSEKKMKKVIRKKSKINPGWVEEDIASNEIAEVADNLDDLFDEAEVMRRTKLQNKFKIMSDEYLKPSKKKSKEPIDSDDEDKEHPQIDLTFKKQHQRVQLDEVLNGDDASNETSLLAQRTSKSDSLKSKNQSNPNETGNAQDDSENINPDDIAKVKPQHLHTALPDTIYGCEDDGFNEYDDAEYIFDAEKKLTIAEAFEDDDIVAEFKREKDDEAKKNGPQEIDLSLPGWGSWGGAGIDPSKQKTKRKMILKFPAPEKRRIDNQGNVVIIENRDEALRKHLVSNLPFPFTSVDDYEQSIRVPIGKDFVPETAHRLLIKPAVRTKSGTIIEPMNENMLVKPAKRAVTKTDRRIAKMVDSD